MSLLIWRVGFASVWTLRQDIVIVFNLGFAPRDKETRHFQVMLVGLCVLFGRKSFQLQY